MSRELFILYGNLSIYLKLIYDINEGHCLRFTKPYSSDWSIDTQPKYTATRKDDYRQ